MISKIKSRVTAILIVGIIVIVGYFIFLPFKTDSEQHIKQRYKPQHLAAWGINVGVVTVNDKDGNLLYKIDLNKAYNEHNANLIKIEHLNMVSYNLGATYPWHLSAERATIFTTPNNGFNADKIILSGNIVATKFDPKEHISITTSEATFYPQEKKIISDTLLTILYNESKIRGKGVTALLQDSPIIDINSEVFSEIYLSQLPNFD